MYYDLYLLKYFVVALTNGWKCGEAGAAALVDTFLIGTGDSMPCWDKIAPYLGETFFYFASYYSLFIFIFYLYLYYYLYIYYLYYSFKQLLG